MQKTHNNERIIEIINAINEACKGSLDERYLFLAENLCKELFEINYDGINKGKVNSWACGIIHAIGNRNNLFKNSNIRVADIYKIFNVSSSTGLSKSKEIRNIIDLQEDRWSVEFVDNTNKSDLYEEVAAELEDSTTNKEIEIDENLLKANKLANDAWNNKSFNKRVRLAKEALKISEECAEAYIILSFDNSLSSEEQKELAKKAVELSSKNINAEILKNYKEDFLDFDLTRTYFSSKYRLGTLLWNMQERQAAIKEFLSLIEVFPKDSLMVRSSLMSWLIEEDMDEELENLLEKYKGDYLASTKFTKALYLYKTGKTEEALRYLRIANSSNPFVIEFLLKQRKMKKNKNKFERLGTEEEAINYIKHSEDAWNSVEGARKWLKEIQKEL